MSCSGSGHCSEELMQDVLTSMYFNGVYYYVGFKCLHVNSKIQ